MAFSSITFLFLYLPIFLIVYFIVPFKWWRNFILFAGSILFYAWAETRNVILLLLVIAVNFSAALGIQLFLGKNRRRWAKAFVVFAVFINLGLLFYYKYADFGVQVLNDIFSVQLSSQARSLPIGISFFIFSAISYVVDVYQESIKAQRNPLTVGLYIAMFPKLLQGPITRFEQMESDMRYGRPSLDDIAAGIRRFIIGLSKKILIADQLAIVANKIMGLNFIAIGADMSWYGLIAYTLQIYFDFSGYMDMAIGLGRILGYHLPENFNYPYISRSISEFWRRWHMTLTAWFRTYVFFPLEYARKKQKFLRQQTNLLIVFLLTGLWHGASWNFVIWGGYFGLILALETSFLGKMLKKIPAWLQHGYTVILIMIGWIIFRLENISLWKNYLRALLGWNGFTGQENAHSLNVLGYLPIVLIAIIGTTPLIRQVVQKYATNQTMAWIGNIVIILLFGLSVAFMIANGYQSFLYFQF